MDITVMIKNLQKYHIKSTEHTLAYTKEKVLFYIILIASAIGMVAYLPSLIGALVIGYYDTAVIDTLFYMWVLYLLLSKKLTYRQRAIMFIVPIWLLSFYLIIRFGIHGAGFLWLLVAPVLTGILLGLKEGGIALLFTSAILVLLGMLIYYFNIIPDVLGESPVLFWFIMSGNTVMITTVIMVSSSIMVNALSHVISQRNKKVKELADTQDAMIETVASLAEYHDIDTGHHIERTKTFVRIIANTLKSKPQYREELTPEYIELLCKSAPLHDIGKIGIPDSILLKEGPLTNEETVIMQKHTLYGRDVLLRSEKKLGSNSFLNLAAEIAYAHQERWDGSGYPLGLKGEEIPLSARIMAIADVYDALRSKRPYKEPMGHDAAIAYLKEQSGILFDPGILAFLSEFETLLSKVYSQKEDMYDKNRI